MSLTINKFADVYNAESKYGKGVSPTGKPLAYWNVSGPSAAYQSWMDRYAGLDKQSQTVGRSDKTYDVQALRMTPQGDWSVIVSNITSKTDKRVDTLLREVGEVKTLKDLFVELWKDEPESNPHPDALAEYHAGKRAQKDPYANCPHGNFALKSNFSYFANH
jgi:hypothetical protein